MKMHLYQRKETTPTYSFFVVCPHYLTHTALRRAVFLASKFILLYL